MHLSQFDMDLILCFLIGKSGSCGQQARRILFRNINLCGGLE